MGERFGKYDLERRLAFGGMAEIFVAALHGERGFAKRVVLKRILPQFGSDPSFVSMFIDEAVLAARLTHPNVVQIYDFGEVEGVYYIAMEMVDGVDLRRLIKVASERRRPLSAAEVAAIGEGVSRGLSYAHAARDEAGRPLELIHRDVSPHNIMLSRSGEAKVMDFGIAKAASRATRTATGTIKGKVAYMAPEQAAGGAVDKRADQFALGLVLWECLTGTRLFVGDSDLELLRVVLACETRPPSSVCPDVPPELDRIVMRALRPQPAERYPDLADMQRDLSAFRFSLGVAGAVQLGALVDELCPPEAAEPARQTLPLPATPAAEWSEARRAETAEVTAALEAAPELAPTRRTPPRQGAPLPAAQGHARSWWLAGAAVMLALGLAGAAGWVRWRAESPAVSTLVVESDPVGAAIRLDGLDTGLVTPARLPSLRRGAAVVVGLSLRGYGIQQRVVTPTLPLELVRATLAPDVPPPATPVDAATTSAGQPADEAPPPARAPAPPARRERKLGTHAPGSLSLRSSGPWFHVYLGGEKIGTTPLVRREMPAGTHRLRLVNPTLGVEKKVEVSITSGRELQKTVEP